MKPPLNVPSLVRRGWGGLLWGNVNRLQLLSWSFFEEYDKISPLTH